MKIVVIGGTGLIGSKLVAAALADVAVSEPVNGIVELAGPERFRRDELADSFSAPTTMRAPFWPTSTRGTSARSSTTTPSPQEATHASPRPL
jgi:uncharacterized protein YbjT (DUF2867 family)